MKLIYDPNETIKENAERCGVSVSAVRQYIRRNGIDRKYDAQLNRFFQVQRLSKQGLSPKEIASELGLALNTAKKYVNPNNRPSKGDTNKVSKIDTNTSTGNIKSVSNNQTEILSNILRLYIDAGVFDCDLTFSKGNFYKHIPLPQHRYDKFPQCDDVLSLEKAYDLPSGCFNSIVVDLPFIIRRNNNINCVIGHRFNAFDNVKDLYSANEEMLRLAHRLLCPNGYLVMKTMDFLHAGKQYWISYFVQQKAAEIGFCLIDTFILVSSTKLLNTGGMVQHHARKYHSYFYVFKRS